MVNNTNPVRVSDTNTTTQTEYRAASQRQQQLATVVVRRRKAPASKRRWLSSSIQLPALTAETAVIFTTITSPDGDKASMYGHMIEALPRR